MLNYMQFVLKPQKGPIHLISPIIQIIKLKKCHCICSISHIGDIIYVMTTLCSITNIIFISVTGVKRLVCNLLYVAGNTPFVASILLY